MLSNTSRSTIGRNGSIKSQLRLNWLNSLRWQIRIALNSPSPRFHDSPPTTEFRTRSSTQHSPERHRREKVRAEQRAKVDSCRVSFAIRRVARAHIVHSNAPSISPLTARGRLANEAWCAILSRTTRCHTRFFIGPPHSSCSPIRLLVLCAPYNGRYCPIGLCFSSDETSEIFAFATQKANTR